MKRFQDEAPKWYRDGRCAGKFPLAAGGGVGGAAAPFGTGAAWFGTDIGGGVPALGAIARSSDLLCSWRTRPTHSIIAPRANFDIEMPRAAAASLSRAWSAESRSQRTLSRSVFIVSFASWSECRHCMHLTVYSVHISKAIWTNTSEVMYCLCYMYGISDRNSLS